MDPKNSPPATSLEQIEARLARIEQSLAKVEQLASQSEALISVASDLLDRSAPAGVSLDDRFRQLAQLAEQGTRPESTQALTMLAAKAPELSPSAATLLDILDSHVAQHPELPSRLSSLLGLAQKASETKNAKALEFALDQLHQIPALVGTMADILDGYAAQDSADASLDNLLINLKTLLGWLAKDSSKKLLEAIPTDAQTLQALELLAKSASKASSGAPKPVGLLGALSKLRSDDAGYALNFACELLQGLGQGLKQNTPSLPQGS